MELIKEKALVKKSHDFDDIKFGTTDEGQCKLIELASSHMYRNPIQSLMTEFVQNALDAHVVAKKVTVPIEITIPTTLSPVYSVRDFGLGMDDDEMKNIFAKIGLSTKDKSNDQLGGFGLGKLVFAAYNGVMNLSSIVKGKKTCWYCRLQNGEGEITRMYDEDTDAPDGVLVEIPIKKDDVGRFQEIATRLYAFIDPLPIVSGLAAPYKLWQPPKDTTKYDTHMVTWSDEVCRCVMGPLPFPVDLKELTGLDHNIREALDKIGLILKFKVGAIDIVPSRDSLRYTDRTKKAIMDAIAVVRTNFTSDFQVRLNSNSNCLFTAFAQLSHMSDKNLDKLLVTKKVAFKNVEIDLSQGYNRHLSLDVQMQFFQYALVKYEKKFSPDVMARYKQKNSEGLDTTLRVDYVHHGKALGTYNGSRWYSNANTVQDVKWRRTRKADLKLSMFKDGLASDKLEFFFFFKDRDNKITHVNTRIQAWIANKNEERTDGKLTVIIEIHSHSDYHKMFKEILYIPRAHILEEKDIPTVADLKGTALDISTNSAHRKVAVRTKVSSAKALKLKVEAKLVESADLFNADQKDNWEPAEVDPLKGTGIYFIIKNYVPSKGNGFKTMNYVTSGKVNFHHIVSSIVKVRPGINFYGFRRTVPDEILQSKTWWSLEEYVLNLLNDIKGDKALLDLLWFEQHYTPSSKSHDGRDVTRRMHNLNSVADVTFVIEKMPKIVKKVLADYEEIVRLGKLYREKYEALVKFYSGVASHSGIDNLHRMIINDSYEAKVPKAYRINQQANEKLLIEMYPLLNGRSYYHHSTHGVKEQQSVDYINGQNQLIRLKKLVSDKQKIVKC